MNGLKVGDSLQFNQWDDKENSKFIVLKIVGYMAVQKLEPVMSGDTGQKIRFLPNMNFPEKPSGEEKSAVRYAILR